MDFLSMSIQQERLLEECTEHFESWRDVFALVTRDEEPQACAQAVRALAIERWGIDLSLPEALEIIQDMRQLARSGRAQLLEACAASPDRWQAVYDLFDPAATPMGRVVDLCDLARSWGLQVSERDAAWFFRSLDDDGPRRGVWARAT